jgi:hypothetical protein
VDVQSESAAALVTEESDDTCSPLPGTVQSGKVCTNPPPPAALKVVSVTPPFTFSYLSLSSEG